MNNNTRLSGLRSKFYGNELDAILISNPENRRYLSGFTGSAGYLIISKHNAVLATDFRYIEQASSQTDFRIEKMTSDGTWFSNTISNESIERLGFESDDITVSILSNFEKEIEKMNSSIKPTLVPTSGIVNRLRAVKDKEELDLIKKAVEISDRAFDTVEPSICPGNTEKQVAWELEKAMREFGADAISFDIIVGSGPNGARPHHRAGNRQIKEGDPIVIDMGASYEGYCSDLSRTIFVGEPDDKFRSIYNTVLKAQLFAEENVKVGMTGEQVDDLAREIIADSGNAAHFGHSLGHGIGLAVHEFPTVGPRGNDQIENGMIFTIEPGIYLPGWGGVRIEDMVIMENGSAQILSKANKLEFSK